MRSDQNKPDNLLELSFSTKKAWTAFLEKNHARSPGIWLKLAKKGSQIETVSYAEAIEVALCYGWIDGQKRPLDHLWWLQRFTPRGPKSSWSKINRAKAEELIESGQMKPFGLKAVESAKADGRWGRAYDSQRSSSIPDDLQAALDSNVKAKAFFATLDSANRYAVLFRVQTAKKAETRAKRIREFVDMLARHQKLHP
jgi:uncharacterized protein YdeI (YjbR/CyaY-like superfamily)